MAAALAVALRQAALAIGLRLVYAAAELFVGSGLIRAGAGSALSSLPGLNATTLADSFAPGHQLSATAALIVPYGAGGCAIERERLRRQSQSGRGSRRLVDADQIRALSHACVRLPLAIRPL